MPEVGGVQDRYGSTGGYPPPRDSVPLDPLRRDELKELDEPYPSLGYTALRKSRVALDWAVMTAPTAIVAGIVAANFLPPLIVFSEEGFRWAWAYPWICIAILLWTALNVYLDPEHQNKFSVFLLFTSLLALYVLSIARSEIGPESAGLISLALVTWFVDLFGKHTFFHLASLNHGGEETRRLTRQLWRRRFTPFLVRQKVAELERHVAGDPTLTNLVPLSRSLTRYRRGFLVVLVAVFCTENILAMALILPIVAAVILGTQKLSASRWQIWDSLTFAFESWLDYGADIEDSPGVFQSPVGSVTLRREIVPYLLVALAVSFYPFASEELIQTAWPIGVLAFNFLRSFVFPAVVLGSLLVATVSPITLSAAVPERKRKMGPSWEGLVRTIEKSGSLRLRRQLFLGFNDAARYPVFLPIPVLNHHAHILGSSGSGKTTRTILPLIAQLIRRVDHPDAKTTNQGPILIIDMKGEDRYPFSVVREAAREAGRPFRFFTNVTGYSTHAFNPLDEFLAYDLTRQQRGEVTRAALNVEHGTGYGPGHFSAISRQYLQLLLETNPAARSFAELLSVRGQLKKLKGKKWLDQHEKDAGELVTALELLSAKPELNVTPSWVSAGEDDEELAERRAIYETRISMAEAFENNEVIYFSLASHFEEATCRHIASFALEAFYAAAVLRNRETKAAEKRPAYIFIDEFQQIAGRNFETFMRQARSSSVSLVLANQSPQDLDADLLNTVVTNTEFVQVYKIKDPAELQAFSAASGQRDQFRNRWVTRLGRVVEGITGLEWSSPTESVPRYPVSAIRKVNANKDLSIVTFHENADWSIFDGHSFTLRSLFHISEDEFERINDLPWPRDLPGTLLIDPEGRYAAKARGEEPPIPRPPTLIGTIRKEPNDPALAALFERIEPVGAPAERYDVAEPDDAGSS